MSTDIERSRRCIATLLVATAWVASCTARQNDAAASAALTAGPCRIALTDPNGGLDGGPDRGIDRRIGELQSRVRAANDPVAYLERLGWAYVAKARTSEDEGYYRLAESAADCIERHRPEAAEALLLRGHVAHNLHHFAEAEALARRLVERRGLWFEYALLGDALMERGSLQQAAAAYQEMMDQRPGPQAYSRAAYLRWLVGDLEGALELMRHAARASGSRDREAAAWHRVRLAHYELQAGHFDEAAALLDSALSLQPGYAPARSMQGRLLLARGRAAEAVEALQDAVERDPLPETLWALLEAARAAGRESEVRRAREQLELRGEAEDPRAFALYLATTGVDRKKALALTTAELAVRRDVFTLDAHAWALHAGGRIDEAYDASREATAAGTQDARLFLHAGIIAASLGHAEEARSWLRRSHVLRYTLLPSESDLLLAHMSPSS